MFTLLPPEPAWVGGLLSAGPKGMRPPAAGWAGPTCLLQVGGVVMLLAQPQPKKQLSRDCASRFGWSLPGITARSALCDTVKVASAGTSVRA